MDSHPVPYAPESDALSTEPPRRLKFRNSPFTVEIVQSKGNRNIKCIMKSIMIRKTFAPLIYTCLAYLEEK